MFGSLRKSISKTISRATEIITGNGPTPAKQFRNAIVDGDEEKAINLYTGSPKEGDKCLYEELHPSLPFPSKKNSITDSPLSLASKYALEKLIVLLLERGGDPGMLNARQETCIHVVCSVPDKPEIRATIIEHFMSWNNGFELGIISEKVSVNKVDSDGNTAIHNAASVGLVSCVEKLVNYGAIISIVNKGNNTCCELADSNNHKDLAMMLELALVFQPEDFDLSQFDVFSVGHTGDQTGKLFLDTHSLTLAHVDSFVEEAVGKISVYLGWMNHAQFRPRAEALLNAYSWDVLRLRRELMDDGTRVLTAAKMDVKAYLVRPVVQEAKEEEKEKQVEELLIDMSSLKEGAVAAQENNEAAVAAEPATTSTPEASLESALTCSENEIKLTFTEEDAGLLASKPISSTVEDNKKEPQESAISPATEPSEPVLCTICCEEMLPEKAFSYFLQDQKKQPEEDHGRHSLSCLSGHSFCLDCWSGHLSVQVNDNGLGYLPCPGYKCGEILDLSWAPILLKNQELVNRLRTQRVRHVVDCAGFKYCPVENCGLIVHVPHNHNATASNSSITRSPGVSTASSSSSSSSSSSLLPHVGMCDNNHLFCVSCLQVAHAPCTCTQYPEWFQLIREETKVANINGSNTSMDPTTASGDDIANALWVAANTKRCPRCSTAIEKDEGCNHMSCRKCRKEFCWICMQDWSLHSENTGGYFQCNRFQDAANGGSSGSNDGGGGGDIWAEERGNAHAETIRLRQRNRKVARFIHHFTRFQAHGQSFQMESRMSKDTYKRIEDGLKLSQEGQLKWLPGEFVPNPITLANASASPASSPRTNTTTTTTTINTAATTSNKNSAVGMKETAVSPLEAALLSSAAEATQNVASTTTEDDPTDPVIQRHYVKPSVYLQFLSDGFHELLKCRQFLQWTYPYAYFEFQDSDDSEYGTSRRRQWLYRTQDHRTSFELMQADLESTVETLSDVCARRRLRASRAQIIQATQAAKQKRIEFESLLLAYVLAKQQAAASQTPSSSSVTSASASRHSTTGGRRLNNHATNSSHRNTPASTRRTPPRIIDDSMDEIANLIRDLELATGSYLGDNTRSSTTNTAAAANRRGRSISFTSPSPAEVYGVAAPPPNPPGDTIAMPPPTPQPTSATAAARNNNSNSNTNSRQRRRRLRHHDSSSSDSLSSDSSNNSYDRDVRRHHRDDDHETPVRHRHERPTPAQPAAHTANNEHNRDSFTLHSALDRASHERSRMGGEEYDDDYGVADEGDDDFAGDATLELLRLASVATGFNNNATNGNSGTIASPTTGGVSTSRHHRSGGSSGGGHRAQQHHHISEARLMRLAQRAEEEEQLNRAILLSLRNSNTAGGSDSNSGGRYQPSETNIATLEAMGFPREAAIDALRASADDVEAAAMQLLG